MAIDDNTLYGLTGVQIKDLATRISSGGGGGTINVVQTTGQSTTDVMSQKAVTDIIGNVETALNAINNGNGA